MLVEPARLRPNQETADDRGSARQTQGEGRESGGVQRTKLEFEYPVFKDRKQVGTCPAVEELLIDWRTGKFHSVGWDANAVKPFEQITAYDGEKVKTQFRSVTKKGKPIGNGPWTYGMITGGPHWELINRNGGRSSFTKESS